MENIIARWMLKEFKLRNYLNQSSAAAYIANHFGMKYVYINQNGNYAIERSILREFRKLTPRNVVWSRSGQYWRLRRPGDPISRMVI